MISRERCIIKLWKGHYFNSYGNFLRFEYSVVVFSEREVEIKYYRV